MRFVIIGAGAVGITLAQRLSANQHDIVLIEKDDQVVAHIPPSLDLQVVHGNGCLPDNLVRAGLANADYVVAVADNDEVNIATALIAKLINPDTKRIVRIRNLDLVHRRISPDLLRDYFDLIINPEKAGADHLFDLYKIPGAQEVIEFANGHLRLLGVQVDENSKLDKKKISALEEYQLRQPFLLVAIVRENTIIVPRGSDRLRAGDLIYALAAPDSTEFILDLAGKRLTRPNSAIIWGGSMIGRFLARSIAATGANVKLIVSDPQLAALYMEELEEILVLQGSGTSQELLIEENVHEVDAFIAVSPHEEENILAALLAKKLGAHTAMALIDKGGYRDLVSAIGVDIAVSAHMAAASTIFRHIHADAVVSEFSLRQRDGSFIEIVLEEDSPIIKQPLQNLKIPHGILIAAVIRDERVLLPRGTDTLWPGDHVIIFVLQSALRRLQQLLNVKLEIVG